MSGDTSVSVGIYLYGEHLEPDAITAVLRIQPTEAGRKGSCRIGRSGREIARRIGVWYLQGVISEDGIDSSINRLLDQFTSFKGIFSNIPTVKSSRLALFFGVDTPDGSTWLEFELSPRTISRLADRGLEVSITFSSSLKRAES